MLKQMLNVGTVLAAAVVSVAAAQDVTSAPTVMETLRSILRMPVVMGAITGALSAAKTDFDAFRKWQSFKEAAAYGWPIALWRWFQGAVIGAVSALGLGLL